MAHAFLPHEGAMWLCLADGPCVTPLARAPGEMTAKRKFSDNGVEFAHLDPSGKRLGYYRLLEQAPWIECLMRPATLPESWFVRDFVIHEDKLIAGGDGKVIWIRRPLVDKFWQPICCPKGKFAHALFVQNNNLMAVNNSARPRNMWMVLDDVELGQIFCPPQTSDQSTDLTCEIDTDKSRRSGRPRTSAHIIPVYVIQGADGADAYALLSCRYNENYETAVFYISLLCKKRMEEVVLWSGFKEKTTEQLFEKVRDYEIEEIMADDANIPLDWVRPLQEQIEAVAKLQAAIEKRAKTNMGEILCFIKDMAFCGNILVLALGTHGIRTCNTALAQPIADDSEIDMNRAFTPLALKKITDVTRLECCQNNSAGFYAVGKNAKDEWTYEWVGVERLV